MESTYCFYLPFHSTRLCAQTLLFLLNARDRLKLHWDDVGKKGKSNTAFASIGSNDKKTKRFIHLKGKAINKRRRKGRKRQKSSTLDACRRVSIVEVGSNLYFGLPAALVSSLIIPGEIWPDFLVIVFARYH